MDRAMRNEDDDSDIVDGPFGDPDELEVEYIENADISIEYELVLDEKHWGLAEKLAAKDGVSVDEAVLKAIREQVKARA